MPERFGFSFASPVRGLEPLGLLRHPELTVTVADPHRLASLLNAHRARRTAA